MLKLFEGLVAFVGAGLFVEKLFAEVEVVVFVVGVGLVVELAVEEFVVEAFAVAWEVFVAVVELVLEKVVFFEMLFVFF